MRTSRSKPRLDQKKMLSALRKRLCVALRRSCSVKRMVWLEVGERLSWVEKVVCNLNPRLESSKR